MITPSRTVITTLWSILKSVGIWLFVLLFSSFVRFNVDRNAQTNLYDTQSCRAHVMVALGSQKEIMWCINSNCSEQWRHKPGAAPGWSRVVRKGMSSLDICMNFHSNEVRPQPDLMVLDAVRQGFMWRNTSPLREAKREAKSDYEQINKCYEIVAVGVRNVVLSPSVLL